MDVKGTAVESLPGFIKSTYGDGGFSRWLAALPDDTRAVFSRPILPSSWYPLRQFMIVPTVKLCELFYGGMKRGAVEVGKYSAETGLRGIYKMFVRLGSTEFLIRKASTILPTYYRPSAMSVLENGRGRALVRITRFEEPHEVVEARIQGWMQRALEISGARGVLVQVAASMTKGDEHSDFKVTWSE